MEVGRFSLSLTSIKEFYEAAVYMAATSPNQEFGILLTLLDLGWVSKDLNKQSSCSNYRNKKKKVLHNFHKAKM